MQSFEGIVHTVAVFVEEAFDRVAALLKDTTEAIAL
jgi:hypothetical protein